jgi:hypothetical protein
MTAEAYTVNPIRCQERWRQAATACVNHTGDKAAIGRGRMPSMAACDPSDQIRTRTRFGAVLPYTDFPTALRTVLTLPPRKIKATIATIAISARMSAYSASP